MVDYTITPLLVGGSGPESGFLDVRRLRLIDGRRNDGHRYDHASSDGVRPSDDGECIPSEERRR